MTVLQYHGGKKAVRMDAAAREGRAYVCRAPYGGRSACNQECRRSCPEERIRSAIPLCRRQLLRQPCNQLAGA